MLKLGSLTVGLLGVCIMLTSCQAHLKPVKDAAERCGKQALSAALESLRICAEEEAAKALIGP